METDKERTIDLLTSLGVPFEQRTFPYEVEGWHFEGSAVTIKAGAGHPKVFGPFGLSTVYLFNADGTFRTLVLESLS